MKNMKEKKVDKHLANTLPHFSSMNVDELQDGLNALLEEGRALVNDLLEKVDHHTWDNFAEPLELQDEKINKFFVIIEHLNMVANTDKLTDIYAACKKDHVAYATELGQNKKLFDAYKSIADGDEYKTLTPSRKKIVDNMLRDFKLSGVDLPEAAKKRYKQIQEELSALTAQFQKNVLDAGNAWSKHIFDPKSVSGIPETDLKTAQERAEKKGFCGWLLTLDLPTYGAVMTYADDQALRREMHEAYMTRASDQGPHAGEYDNTDIMDQILALRHEEACMLGFRNFAELSIYTKMAETTDEVMSFLDNLVVHAHTAARKEFEELSAFAKEHHAAEKLAPWDVAYYSEKLKQHHHNVSSEEVQKYFPVTSVMEGAFEVVKRLYGIRVCEIKGIDVWHPDVKFFEVYGPDGQLRGGFYTDLYVRTGKQGGAWADGFVYRRCTSHVVQVPIGVLVCNFQPSFADYVSTLTHNDVVTFFHELGHTLHNILTTVSEPGVSGFAGVERDAIELPSQFMENWCWEEEALAFISSHHETGKPLPEELLKNMQSSRNFQTAMFTVRQLIFALFDFRIHLEYDPSQGARVMEIWKEVRESVAVLPEASFARTPHNFMHIFSMGYSAGYYSYKWADVLAADAFSKFQENGIFDRKTGNEFLNSVLERGGSRGAMENFKEFRGREPEVAALLKKDGLL